MPTPTQKKRGRVATIYSPLWPERTLQLKLKKGKARIADEREKWCPGCSEFWPADTEFFHAAKSEKDGLSSSCIACYNEWKQERRARA